MKLGLALSALAGVGALVLADESSSWFVDITHPAGIDHRHTNRTFHNPYANVMAGYTALGAAVCLAQYDRQGYGRVGSSDFLRDEAQKPDNHKAELQLHH